MRSLFLSAVLGAAALGLLAMTPSQSQAQRWGRWGGAYYPGYSYYNPGYSGYYPSYGYSYYPSYNYGYSYYPSYSYGYYPGYSYYTPGYRGYYRRW